MTAVPVSMERQQTPQFVSRWRDVAGPVFRRRSTLRERVAAREPKQGSRMGAGLRANRLAAAVLIPVGDNGLKTLVNLAYPGVIPEHNAESTEDTTDAAA